jgi:hypothetical protein
MREESEKFQRCFTFATKKKAFHSLDLLSDDRGNFFLPIEGLLLCTVEGKSSNGIMRR